MIPTPVTDQTAPPLLRFSGMPPATADMWQGGFNLGTLSFRTAPVFDLQFTREQFIKIADYGGQNLYYQVPDNVMVDQRGCTATHHTASSLQTESDFENEFGVSVDASDSDDFVDCSVDSSFSFKGSLFSDVTKTYEVSFFVCKSSGFRVYETARLATAFVSAVQNAIAKANTATWTALFDLYGTHYITRGDMGGFYSIQTTTDTTVYEKSTSEDMHAAFKADFDDVISSGSLSIAAYSSNSSFYSTNASSTTIDSYSRGGILRGGYNTGTLDDFALSCEFKPALLALNVPGVCNQPVFATLSSLFSDQPDTQKAIKAAIDAYLAFEDPGQSLRLAQGFWQNISADCVISCPASAGAAPMALRTVNPSQSLFQATSVTRALGSQWFLPINAGAQINPLFSGASLLRLFAQTPGFLGLGQPILIEASWQTDGANATFTVPNIYGPALLGMAFGGNSTTKTTFKVTMGGNWIFGGQPDQTMLLPGTWMTHGAADGDIVVTSTGGTVVNPGLDPASLVIFPLLLAKDFEVRVETPGDTMPEQPGGFQIQRDAILVYDCAMVPAQTTVCINAGPTIASVAGYGQTKYTVSSYTVPAANAGPNFAYAHVQAGQWVNPDPTMYPYAAFTIRRRLMGPEG